MMRVRALLNSYPRLQPKINIQKYKNKPRSMPKNKRKFLKENTVLDEDEDMKTIFIEENNYEHETKHTVYGNSYKSALSDKDKSSIKES